MPKRLLQNTFDAIKDNRTYSDEGKSKGELDDYPVRKYLATKEGTIEKVPVNDSDIVNLNYIKAGRTGDIWVEKAGDTMSGDLNMGSRNISNVRDLALDTISTDVDHGTKKITSGEIDVGKIIGTSPVCVGNSADGTFRLPTPPTITGEYLYV